MRHSGQHRQPNDRQPDDRTTPGSDLTWRGWQQPRGRRALRLIAALGTIAGGLCVVLAMTGLVVEFGSRQPNPARVINGHPHQPKRIHMPAGAGLYGVAWSFTCAPGQSGSFTLTRQATTGSMERQVTAFGQHGHSTWWPRPGQAGQTLSIVSDCAWSAKIVKSAKPGAATPRSGNGATHKPEHQHKTHEIHGQQERAHKRQHGRTKKRHERAGQRGLAVQRAASARRFRSAQSKIGGASRLRLSS